MGQGNYKSGLFSNLCMQAAGTLSTTNSALSSLFKFQLLCRNQSAGHQGVSNQALMP